MIFLFSNQGIANSAKKHHRAAQSTQAPFDVSLETLPPGYKGMDIKKVFDVVSERFKRKGEFETEESYASRIETEKRGDAARLYAFQPCEATSKYDVSAGGFIISIQGGYASGRHDWFPVRRDYIDHGSYLAQNAFGAKIKVKRLSELRWVAALPDKWSTSSTMDLFFPCPVDRAKTLKDRLRVLIVVALVEPFWKEESDHGAASFDSPIEARITTKALIFETKALWIYDYKTGEILQKSK